MLSSRGICPPAAAFPWIPPSFKFNHGQSQLVGCKRLLVSAKVTCNSCVLRSVNESIKAIGKGQH